jgi:hypothetical protein
MHRIRNYPANYQTIPITELSAEFQMQTTDQFLITHQSTELLAEFQITRNELCIELPITLQTIEQFLITEQST